MKKLILLGTIVLLVILARCTKPQPETALLLLADPKFRAEAIHEIATNEVYLSELANKVAESKMAPPIYRMTPAVIKTVWESEKMDSLIDADGTVMQKMIQRAIHKMDQDSISAEALFNQFIENERFKNYVIRYQYGRQKELKSKQ